MEETAATTLQLLGAGGFGAIIGWYIYYINRYRKEDVQLSDLVTIIGAIGGGAVLALFKPETDLFGAYGIGLFAGFFLYFLLLILFTIISPNFDIDFFLDGRRRKPKAAYYIPHQPPIDDPDAPVVPGGQRPMGNDGPQHNPPIID